MDKIVSLLDNFVKLNALKKFNRIAAVVAVLIFLSTLTCLVFFNSSKKDLEGFFKAMPGTLSSLNLEAIAFDEKPYEDYSQAIGDKVLFVSMVKKTDVKASANPAAGLKNISLVGILSGDTLQAIVEDKLARKTYYLDKGQQFNGMTVQDIQDNAVVLEYNGNTETLTL